MCLTDRPNMKRLQEDVQKCSVKMSAIATQINQQDEEIALLREEVQKLLTELAETRACLKNIVEKLADIH